VRLLPVGRSALLVEVADASQASALALWARERGVAADEIVPAARTVLFDGVEQSTVAAAITEWAPDPSGLAGADADRRVVEVPVVYDGEDLAEVARLWDCSAAEVVTRHTAIEFRSLFCGFAPGFAYLSGLPAELAVPRRADPRPSVPAGSVALAGEWCGVYPTSSPGGWLLLGRTDLRLWDPDSSVPATLAPGTLVRFVAVA
jgi:KipI family sensor histidine kinase inhibitor